MFYFLFVAYQLLQLVLLPILPPIIALGQYRRLKRGSYWHKSRLGLIPACPRDKKILWIHAVSVGEALSVQELIRLIKHENPTVWCHLTVGTTSAHKIALSQIPADSISFLPYDLFPCMLLGYWQIQPHTLIVVEGDLWPNLIMFAKVFNVPAFLLNARISKRSEGRFRQLAPLISTMLNTFNHIFTQSSAERDRFISIGVDSARLSALGDIKTFNVVAKKEALPTIPSASQTFDVLLAGSIHPEEELVYLTLFNALKSTFPKLKLILAPRHFHWRSTLEQKITAAGLTYGVWDERSINFNLTTELEKHDVVAVCKMGELFKLYPHATLFYLGGTFVPVGGHNLLEPAVWGIPSIVGPYRAFCAATLEELLKHDAARGVQTEAELLSMSRELLNNHTLAERLGTHAQQWTKKEAQQVYTTLRQSLLTDLF